MVAAVLTLIWQVPSVGVKPDVRAGIVVGKAVKVSQQALSQRFLSFPAELFEHVFMTCCQLQARWHQGKTTSSVAVKYAHKHFENIWIADGSTLEALFRKLESLQDAPGKLAGKLCTVTY